MLNPTREIIEGIEGLRMQNFITGFLDETSPQLDRKHSKRLWPFNKSAVKKNTTKMRANTLGFYAINGEGAVDFNLEQFL